MNSTGCGEPGEAGPVPLRSAGNVDLAIKPHSFSESCTGVSSTVNPAWAEAKQNVCAAG